MTFKGQYPKNRKTQSYSSFTESLRDLAVGTGQDIKDDLLKQLPKDIHKQAGLQTPHQSENTTPDSWSFNEQHELRQKARQIEIIHRQEKVLFSAKEQETTRKIAILYNEVQKLGKAQKSLSKEIKIASFQVPINPGEYHISFVEKLISFIKNLTKTLEDAASWVSTVNQKNKKRSYYWKQVQNSGTKFMLSQERYMSTQAG